MPGLLLLPALLAGAAAAAWTGDPAGSAGRRLALGAALAAMVLAGLAPAGTWDSPWLLLGARTGLDAAGRGALVTAAALLLLARRGGPAAHPGAAPAWLALLAGGLCAAAVAFDAGVLAAGHVASLLAAYGLSLRAPGGRRAAARLMAAAVAGEVLLVDALAEYGHAAESAHLDAMRDAASGELGPVAPLLLVAAFGLPLLLAGLERLVAPAWVIAAEGALATSRLATGPGTSRGAVAALTFLGLAALAAGGGLLGRAALARWPRPPTPAGPGGHGGAATPAAAGHAADRAAPSSAPPRAAGFAWVDVLETRLGRGAGSGLLLLALVVALSLGLALRR
ncbi:MAG: hypothetical protein IPO09_03570 [Anaeromyxobacter sp.]|nr:hypothetical protein [Anaeromyxobacter sp.]MBL0275664.1 hypothetical protein [Anaeromyxobacter sp.]